MSKRQQVAIGLKDNEEAARDLTTAQQAAARRPRLYRILHVHPRQTEDIIMSGWLSDWLCRFWSTSGDTPKQP